MTTRSREGAGRNLDLTSMVVRLPQHRLMEDDELLEFSGLNPDLRIELSSEGDLIIMPPAGGETGAQSAEIVMQLGSWAKQNRTGKVFDSSTGFRLPNGAVRSPDAAWVSAARWKALSPEQRRKFPPLCPDLVVELVSQSDSLRLAQEKMREYLANGARLGWLIDPGRRRVDVYSSGGLSRLDQPESLSDESVLPGFRLDLREVW